MAEPTAPPTAPAGPEIDWLGCRYVAIDVEGTASPAGQPEGLVELAAVELRLGGALGRTFHSLLDPGMPITPIGTRIHGLRDRDVQGQPTLPSLCPRLSELLDGAVVVAHNARVDWGLLQRDCPTLRPLAALDTLRMSRSLWPEVRQHGMDAVIERLGVVIEVPPEAVRGGRHTALHDAIATARVLVGMVELARERGRDVAELLAGSVLPGSRPEAAPRAQMDLFMGSDG